MGYCNDGCWGDTFMSRDTLLTGRPLPGWPGRTPPKSADRNEWVLAKCATTEKSTNNSFISSSYKHTLIVIYNAFLPL